MGTSLFIHFRIPNKIHYRSGNQNIEVLDEQDIHLNQHDVILEKSAYYELFEDVESVDNTQTRKLHEKPTHSIIELEASQKSKSRVTKRRDLHLRSDVVNKTLLRAVKRFYMNKFKIVQKSMVRKGFKNVKTSHILHALAKF